MKPSIIIHLKRRNPRNGIQPIETTIKKHKIISRILNSNSSNSGVCKKGGSCDWEAGKEETFEYDNDSGVFEEEEFELKRRPDTYKEGSVCGEERRENC